MDSRKAARDFLAERARMRAAEKLLQVKAAATAAAGKKRMGKPGEPRPPTPPKRTGSPQKKRSRLGGVVYSEEEAAAILAAGSSHEEEAAAAEAEAEAVYFARAEAKEKVESAATTTTELRKCKVVVCKACHYTAAFQSDFCRGEGHLVFRTEATKRFFKCGGCGQRNIVYDQPFPVEACRKCGAKKWAKTGMKEERKGPKLPSEQLKVPIPFSLSPKLNASIVSHLQIRGEEEKFVGR